MRLRVESSASNVHLQDSSRSSIDAMQIDMEVESNAEQSPRRSARRATAHVVPLCLSGDTEEPHTQYFARGHDRRQDSPVGDRVEAIGDKRKAEASVSELTVNALALTPSAAKRRSRDADESHLANGELSRLNMLTRAKCRARPPSSRGSHDNSFNESSGHKLLSFSDDYRSASGTSMYSLPHSGSSHGSRSSLFETPPCHRPDAFEQHATLVACPAPVRPTARPACSRSMPINFSLDF